MSDPIPCPDCQTTAEPAVVLGSLRICGHCGASLVADLAGVRKATHKDMAHLPLEDLQTLRRARGKIARAGA